MAKNSKPKGDTDWMKYFCFIFGALVLVVGFMYFRDSRLRKEYAVSNVMAQKLVTGEGMRALDGNGNPQTIPGLAVQVHQYTSAYKEAMAGSKGGISQSEMNAAATNAGMNQIHASPERTDEVRSKNYQTVSRDFTYAPASLDQLVRLMFNIERKGRLRVF